MGRTHLAITVELVSGGHAGDLWPRPGRIMIASRSTTFEQLATAIDDAFARWDRPHLHEFTLTDGTPISPASAWDGDGAEGTLDGCKARLGRLQLGKQFAYVFDLGDGWKHLCTVADGRADPRWKRLASSPADRCSAGAGAASPTSTAATGTATTATPRRRPPPTC